MPHPTWAPANFIIASVNPNKRNETIIPNDDAAKLFRTVFSSPDVSESSFRDSTGNTHGIKFRINPPANAARMIGTLIGLGAGGMLKVLAID